MGDWLICCVSSTRSVSPAGRVGVLPGLGGRALNPLPPTQLVSCLSALTLPPPLTPAAGILPFGTLFIELYFDMTSLWLGYFYYLFGFVFLIALLTAIINAEISVLCTYVQLCAEDYLWWCVGLKGYYGGAWA